MRVDVLKRRDVFHRMNDKGALTFEAPGKTQGVLLMTSDSSNRYSIHFEYEDLNRWSISNFVR